MVEQDKPIRQWTDEQIEAFWRDIVVSQIQSDGETIELTGSDFNGTHFTRKGDWEDVVALELPGVADRVSVTSRVIREEGLARRTFFVPQNGIKPQDFLVSENSAPDERARMIFKH